MDFVPLVGIAPESDFTSLPALSSAEESVAKSSAVLLEVKGRNFTVSPPSRATRTALLIVGEQLFERTFQDAQDRLQLELIDDLLSPCSENAAALARRAGQFGWQTTFNS